MDELNGLADVMADRFFKERDKELLQKLKAEGEGEVSRAALTKASGIEDPVVLDAFLEEGISLDTVAAISLIPLVSVAWADREMETKERVAILKAAADAGIAEGSPSYELLDSWLGNRPEAHLLDSWVLYIKSMKEKLDPTAISQLKSSVLSRANEVAASAGGYLGLGNKVSETEKNVIATLESAFN